MIYLVQDLLGLEIQKGLVQTLSSFLARLETLHMPFSLRKALLNSSELLKKFVGVCTITVR